MSGRQRTSWCAMSSLMVMIWLMVSDMIYGQCNDLRECEGDIFETGSVNCGGELSCLDTVIIGSTSTRWILGAFAAKNAVFRNAASVIRAYGAFSLTNTVIHNSATSLTLLFYGYYSGYNAVLYCSDGSTCNVICHALNCINFQLICDETSTCSVNTPLYTDDALLVDGEFYRGLSVVNPPSETYASYPDGTVCSTTSSCAGFSITVVDSDYKIYCSATSSCNSISATFGSGANNGMLLCSGDRSCLASSLLAGSSSNNILYCGGYLSCGNAEIRGFRDIYVVGLFGTQGSTLYSDNNADNEMNVYFSAYKATGEFHAGGTIINCAAGDTCNIYCEGTGSCEHYTLQCSGTCNEYDWVDDTNSPTHHPTNDPTPRPTPQPTRSPTLRPTPSPTPVPTPGPTVEPTENPTEHPTVAPSEKPTESPSRSPTFMPTSNPTSLFDVLGFEPPAQCDEDPCSCDEVENCGVCNEGSGCSQCASGYFKSGDGFQCADCQEVFGDYCLHCGNNDGCQQCDGGSTRTYNEEYGLYYCEVLTSDWLCPGDCDSNPCTDEEDPFCENRLSGGSCQTCENGYFVKDSSSGNSPCVQCQETFGTACQNCQNGQGCVSCAQGFTKQWDSSCQLFYCQPN